MSWQFTVQPAPWQFTVENTVPLRSDSAEYVYGTWQGLVPITFDPPKVGFVQDEDGTPTVWFDSEWVTPAGLARTCAVKVGPGSAVGVLPAGRWWMVPDFVAGTERVRRSGSFHISPGDATAEVIVNPVLQLTPDPDHPGYAFLTGGNFTEDPDHPGLIIVGDA